MTTSDLAVTVTEHDRQKTVSCYAINAELGETVVESKVVSVICKPLSCQLGFEIALLVGLLISTEPYKISLLLAIKSSIY